MAITAETRKAIIELVVTAYNQAPGTTLLNELVAIVDAGGTLADVATSLTTSDTWSATYPAFQTAEEFATEWLGTLVPEASAVALAEGVDIAVGLVNGGASFADIIIVAQEFLSALPETDASFGTSAAGFNNKVEVATYHTITQEIAAAGTDTLSGVDSTEGSVTTAKAAVDTAEVTPGTTFTLTTALDNKTMGAGDDQAFATDSLTAASDTFNVSDKIDGGAGEDTFFLTFNDNTADVSYTPSRISNFETLSITNIDDAESISVNASLMGITGVQNSASSKPVTVTGVAAGTTLDAMGNTGDTTLTVLGAGLTGLEDTAVISLTGNTGAISYTSSTAQDIEKAAFTVTGVNSGAITITDSGANSAVTSATVSGSGSYDMESGGGTFDDVLTTLDASANTGGVTFTATVSTGASLTGGAGNDVLTGAAGNDVIKGGAGDDTLTMGASGVDNIDGGAGDDVVTINGLTEDDTIAGGDGADTLVIGAAVAYDDEATPTPIDDAANISGFETVRGTAALTQDMAAFSGVVALQTTGGVLTATEASGIADFYAYGLTDLSAAAGLDLTLATDGTADAINIHLGSDVAQTNASAVTIDAIELETALIASKGKDGNIITDFEADALTELTVTGSKNLTVTLNDSAAVATIPLTKVDASAFTGDTLSITAQEADSGVTVTTGSEALTVTVGDGTNNITGTAGDDTITTGSGADTIVSYGGDDTIEAGDGVNIITVTDGENDIDGGEGLDTITAGKGNNTIDGGDGADVIVAGSGNNTITNSAGNATITAGSGNNTVTNTAGNSSITLGGGTNTVNLTAGNSTVVTGDGADDINITAGNNNITAGAGNDAISLGSGNDTVDAGAGTDTVDFSVSSGTWTGSISEAETIAATFAGSATIDFDGISDFTTISVSASATATTTKIKNVGSSTVSVTDDSVESGGTGNIGALTIDATADAAIALSVGGNQNAAVATESDLTSLTVTDAASLAVSATGGSLTNVIQHDLTSIAMDDDETTSLTVTTGAYSGIDTGSVTSTESLESVALTASGAEADINSDSIEDGTNLSSLSITASGLNADINVEEVGGTTAAILDTLSVTATNGSTIDTINGDEAAITTSENMTSYIVSATGASSNIDLGQLSADGLQVATMTLTAADGGEIDMESAEADPEINYLPVALAMATSGTGSVLDANLLTQDAGSLAATESSITIDAEGASSVLDLQGSTLGGADVDLVSIEVGAYATLNMGGSGVDAGTNEESDTQSTITASGSIGELALNFAAYSDFNTLESDLDAETDYADALTITGDNITTLDLDIASNAALDAEGLVIASSGETSDDLDGLTIKTAEIDIGDQSAAVIVDFEAASGNVLSIGGDVYLQITDDATQAPSVYEGNVNVGGSSAVTVTIATAGLDATNIVTSQGTAGSEGTFGAFTIGTGSGNDTITGGSGIDTITSGAGDDEITGGVGNDIITAGNGADGVDGGTGADQIDLTETVSGADVVEYAAVLDGSAVGADEGTFTAFDVITGFDTLVDHIDHNAIALGKTFVIANTLGAADLAAANYADVDSVLAFLNDATVEDTIAADSADYALNEDIVVAVTLGNGTTAIYELNDVAAGTLIAADISLLGTVDTTMVIGDFM